MGLSKEEADQEGRRESMIDHVAADRFDQLWTILCDDVVVALKRAESEVSPESRRAALRAVFAFVEGAIFLLKDLTLARIPAYRAFFTEAEIALLRDEQYSVNAKGAAETQAKCGNAQHGPRGPGASGQDRAA